MIFPSSRTPQPARKPEAPTRLVTTIVLCWSALLRLCPRAFRQSYGVEMEQILRLMLADVWRQRGAWGLALLWAEVMSDLLRGAAGAHMDDLGLSIEALRRSWLMSRMRSSAIIAFSAYIALVLTGMGFQKLTEDIMKTNAPVAHPGIALAHSAIIGGAVLALLAVLVGGLPIAWDAIRHALTGRRWGELALWAVPPISLAIWLGWTWTILNVIQPTKQVQDIHQPFFIGIGRSWVGLFILAAIVSVAAVSAAINRSQIAPERYRFALRAALVTVLGMLVTAAGVAAFGLQVQAVAPADLATLASPLAFGESTGTSLVIQVIVMSLATVIAAVSVFRGLSAPPTRQQAATALA